MHYQITYWNEKNKNRHCQNKRVFFSWKKFFFLDECFSRLPSGVSSGCCHLLALLNLSRAIGKYHGFLCLHLVQIPNRRRLLFLAQTIVWYQTCLHFNARKIKFLWIVLKTWQLIKRCVLKNMAWLYHIFLFSWRWKVWSKTSL